MERTLVIREAIENDSKSLIKLYSQLNKDDPTIPEQEFSVKLNSILANDALFIFVYENEAGDLIGTCYLNVIDNLTRNLSPYGVIENVVIDEAYRNRGIGQEIIRYALNNAWELGCYKTMLLTGSKKKSTLHFYERCGFQVGKKTAFLARPA